MYIIFFLVYYGTQEGNQNTYQYGNLPSGSVSAAIENNTIAMNQSNIDLNQPSGNTE